MAQKVLFLKKRALRQLLQLNKNLNRFFLKMIHISNKVPHFLLDWQIFLQRIELFFRLLPRVASLFNIVFASLKIRISFFAIATARFKDADFPLLSGLYKEMTDGYLPVISVVLSVDPSMIKMN